MERTLDRYFYRDQPGESFDSQWLSGCFLMLRRQAVEEVGAFDESFGKYFEDVDICLRMARAGWRVMHHGATSAAHRAACQPARSLHRRLAAPPLLSPLAAEVGLPHPGGSRSCAQDRQGSLKRHRPFCCDLPVSRVLLDFLYSVFSLHLMEELGHDVHCCHVLWRSLFWALIRT